jgi:hypothetical protein
MGSYLRTVGVKTRDLRRMMSMFNPEKVDISSTPSKLKS